MTQYEVSEYKNFGLENLFKKQDASYLNDVASFIKQNTKCKVGTYDDTNACGPSDENITKNVSNLELTPKEKFLVAGYTHTSYAKVNYDLRYPNKAFRTPEDKKLVSDTISVMEKVINNSPLKEDMVLYRGMGDKFVADNFDSLKGSIIQDNGFISTTTDIDKAGQFAGVGKIETKSPARIVARIVAPKGTNALRIGEYDESSPEKEFVLQHGTKFEVVGTEKTKNTWFVDMKVAQSQKLNSLLEDVADFMKLNYRCKLGEVESGTYKCGLTGDSPNLSEIAKMPIIKEIASNPEKYNFTGNESDKILEAIGHEKGFDRPVKVVSQEEFDKLRSGNTPLMFRGVNRPEFAKRFKNDKVYYNSWGTFGNGIYTGIGKEGYEIAKQYAGNNGAIIPLVLDEDAKIADFEDILKESKSDVAKLEEYYSKNPGNESEHRVISLIYNDFGKYAAMKGYDAIQVSNKRTYGSPWMVVLNRSKLVTTEEPLEVEKQNQFKLNYKCRKEDSPDGSNKCTLKTKNDLSSKKSDIRITVPAGIVPPGTTAAEIGSKFKQPSGAPIRGIVIAANDPKIPEVLYHFTTHGEAVARDGVLRAGGVGGLGGDRKDQIVSMTTDPEIANALKNDMIFAAKYGKAVTDNPPPQREWNDQKKVWEGDRTEWFNTVVAPLLKQKANDDGFTKFDPNNDILIVPESYGPDDHLRSYFQSRESSNRELGKETPTKFKNPLIYTDVSDLAKINPDDIKVVSIPKKNLDQGQLLTDFDLDNPFGLKEIRSYGDIPLETPVKLNEFDNRNNQTCIYLNEVTDFLKLNKKCKVGTFDDSNKCGPEKENNDDSNEFNSVSNDPVKTRETIAGLSHIEVWTGIPPIVKSNAPKLSVEETALLDKYFSKEKYSHAINKASYNPDLSTKSVIEKGNKIESIINRSILPINIVSFSGASDEEINELLTKNTISSFVSTSMDKNVTHMFGKNVIEFRLPKGTNALIPGYNLNQFSEHEVLLNRNVKFDIVSNTIVNNPLEHRYIIVTPSKSSQSPFQEVSSYFNPELGGFHTTDYKTTNNKPVRIISQDKVDNTKLLEAIKDIEPTQLPSQFLVMKMKAGTPAKYYKKTDSIGVDKSLSSNEMTAEIKKVLESMKTNSSYLEEGSDFIKLNYKCKREDSPNGTNKCNIHSLDNNENFTKDERYALQLYASIEYLTINQYLNGDLQKEYKDNPKLYKKLSENAELLIKKLDSAFEKSKIISPITSYRGLNSNILTKHPELNSLLNTIGSEITFKSFTSSSLDMKIASNKFASGKNDILLQLELPPGSSAINMDKISRSDDEKELLINRDTKFKVKEITTKIIENKQTRIVIMIAIHNSEVKRNSSYLQEVADYLILQDAAVKLNANCKDEEKVGSGPGSCSGGNANKTSNNKKNISTSNSIQVLKKEVLAKKNRSSWESPDHGYEPIEFKLNDAQNLGTIKAELSLPGYSYREGPFTKWKDIDPIGIKDVTPCLQKMSSLIKEENLPPMKFIAIEANRFGRIGSAVYNDDSISIDRSIFSKETLYNKIKENTEYKNQYGRLSCSTGLAKDVQELADICVTHEVGHHSITTYVRNNGGPKDVNEAYLGDQSWKSVINEVINDNWKPPTKYSEINTGELFAECYTYYRKGLVKALHPKIVNYIENVISFNKNNIKR